MSKKPDKKIKPKERKDYIRERAKQVIPRKSSDGLEDEDFFGDEEFLGDRRESNEKQSYDFGEFSTLFDYEAMIGDYQS